MAKEELLSEMLKTIEDKENEIYSQLRDRMTLSYGGNKWSVENYEEIKLDTPSC